MHWFKQLKHSDKRIVLAGMIDAMDVFVFYIFPAARTMGGILIIDVIQYWILGAYLYKEERDAGLALEVGVDLLWLSHYKSYLAPFFPGFFLAVIIREKLPGMRPIMSTIGGFMDYIKNLAASIGKIISKKVIG